METLLQARLRACERSQRRLLAAFVVVLALALYGLIAPALSSEASPVPADAGSLRLTELVIVDPHGVERVRIGGDLPDAVIDGKQIPRGSAAAGVMLYDRTGQERGGYVTWDEGDHIGLTLDGRKGQNALFAAGPDGSTVAQLWHGSESIELRADANGARLTQTSSDTIRLQQPEIAALAPATCAMFRNGLRDEVPGGLDQEQIRGICLRRFSTTACSACLDSTEDG